MNWDVFVTADGMAYTRMVIDGAIVDGTPPERLVDYHTIAALIVEEVRRKQ